MRLSELQTGDKAYIVKVNGSGAFRKRILEMGFVRGQEVKSILNAPLKDPIKYGIMEYEVSLRRSEAVLIEISKLIEDAMYGPENDEPDELGDIVEEQDAYGWAQSDGSAAKRRTPARLFAWRWWVTQCRKNLHLQLASGATKMWENYSGVTIDSKEGPCGTTATSLS